MVQLNSIKLNSIQFNCIKLSDYSENFRPCRCVYERLWK